MTEAFRKPFMPPTLDMLQRDWRQSFIRAATANVIARIQKLPDAGAILRAAWPDDDRANLILRAPVEPTKLAALSGNAVTRLLLLAPKSAAARLLDTAIKIDLTGVSSFSFPLATNFTEATFIGEGMPIPVGDGTFAAMPVGPVRKVASIAALTNELERASADTAAIIISHVLEVAVGRGLDWFYFRPMPQATLHPLDC